MDDSFAALGRLPGRYGFALFLREVGLGDEEIAQRLDLDVASTRMLLEVADAKWVTLKTALVGDKHREAERE